MQVNITCDPRSQLGCQSAKSAVSGRKGGVCECGQPVRPKTKFCSESCRFWAKVSLGPHCWMWTGALKSNAKTPRDRWYGQFHRTASDGSHGPVGAHVAAYELTYGPLEEGEWVLHHCDTPQCVRPDHLFKGNQKLNMEDASAKGRLNVPRLRAQKLTPDQVDDIRAAYATGKRGIGNQLAREYSVSRTTISLIVNGKRRIYDAPQRPVLEQVS